MGSRHGWYQPAHRIMALLIEDASFDFDSRGSGNPMEGFNILGEVKISASFFRKHEENWMLKWRDQ